MMVLKPVNDGHDGIEDFMAYQQQKGEPKIWRWRIRAMSSDSQTVTLGKYETENEARLDYDRIKEDKSYRDVSIEQITPAH